MALHDPVQDDINRQLRSAIPARQFGIAGQVQDLVGRGELSPEAGERVSLNARANVERDQRLAREREEARRAELEKKRAKAFLDRRQGQASLATANAALAKARPGANKIGDEGLAALSFSPEEIKRFSGKLTRATARTASTSRSREKAAAIKADTKGETDRQKRIDKQRQANVRANQFKIREDRLERQNLIAGIDKQLEDTSPESIQKIREVFNQLTGDQGVALPADQVQTYQDAARANLPDDATPEELKAEATRLAEEDGYSFLP